MKKIVSILMVSLMISCLFSCGKKASNEQASNNAAVTNSASANVPAEYKQVTTNENGVKIYGKVFTAETASETGKKVLNINATSDKRFTADHYCIYSEYISEAYGGTVIIRTDNKDGSQEIYNEEGQRFLSSDSKAAKYDLENTLAKYRLGNAMAEAIDRKANGK